MKKMNNHILNIILAGTLIFGYSCDNSEDIVSPEEITYELLTQKTGGWGQSEVEIPYGSATLPSEWVDFSVSFDESKMIPSGHPDGADNVWPSGQYIINESGDRIIRLVDDVEMHIESIDESELTVTFEIPEGVHLDGRVQVLKGKYRFRLK